MKTALISACVCLCLSTSLAAQVYHYQDERGRKVYVDRLSQVPHQYRDQLQELFPPPSPEEQARQQLLRMEQLSEQAHTARLRELDAQMKALEMPVQIEHNSVLVPVRVVHRGRSVSTRLILDTGASSTVFHHASLSRLTLQTRPAGYAQVASGHLVETHSAQFDHIEIGPYSLRNQRAQLIDFQGNARHDGLLGMDFLRQVPYELDFDRSMMIWEPARYAQLREQREALLNPPAPVQPDADPALP